MKKEYLVIAVFVIWCAVSALWYMFSVKGLPQNTALVPATTTSLAIIEILVMLTVAFFLGLATVWIIKSTSEKELKSHIAHLIESNEALEFEHHQAERRIDSFKAAQDTLASRLADVEGIARSSQQELEEARQHIHDQTSRATAADARASSLEAENNSLKFRIRILENDLAGKSSSVQPATEPAPEEAEEKPLVPHRDWSDHPFVRPLTNDADERDDLTEIKGIGPAFQRKLNALDIYTFRQISELSGEGVERLAEVIEVFPERIHRDNWVGQATRLYMKKIEKAG